MRNTCEVISIYSTLLVVLQIDLILIITSLYGEKKNVEAFYQRYISESADFYSLKN